ncbi:tetratricopeptide repeat protein [Sphaerotilus mobilis]|uniref:Putative O-linked N-acetylglucosamine transferase (SPINDLY family) n=1 Tax=Sphaerotilus mobilis TaxID=47994 RepID=A0A4Q7LQ20_9BURK|nr:tetratricopeptide repeat protein [Sphaerotilus mobilis]RZS56895.1 putative O-linked N-acetylglucosamine transferase (SPINDLY family) [Sphaerotilus mobilis]
MTSSPSLPSPASHPEPALPWPRWLGADLAASRALLVVAGPDLASNLAAADALATLAARGIRVLLRLPATQADWLARVWGVWAVWPVDREGHTEDRLDPGDAPPDLVGAVDAWIPLGELPALLGAVADGPWPRLHLGAAYVTSLFDEADAQGQPDRADTLWIGSCLDNSPQGAPAMDLLDGLAEPLRICAWHWREPVDSLDDVTRARRLGRWPDLAAAATDRLLLARRIATLDLLVTHQPEAATLAWALGKPVWWLASGPDADLPSSPPPAHLGAPTVVTVQDLPGALAAWAPSRRHALRRQSPDDALAGVVEAINACQQGALDAARDHALQLLISHPQRPDAWRLLGLIGQTTGQLAWAERCHARVTEVAPAWPDGWKSLGLLRVELARTDPAIDALTRALALAPSDGGVRGPLARLHDERGLAGDADLAITLYREGLGHQPAETDWQLALASLLIGVGEPEAALSYLDACLRQLDASHAGHARALRLSARAHAARGDTDAAAACLRRCLERRPGDAQAVATLARLYRQAGLNSRARELLRLARPVDTLPDPSATTPEADAPADLAWRDLEAWWLLRLSDPTVAPDDRRATAAAAVLAVAPRAQALDTALWCTLAPLLDDATRAALRPAHPAPDAAAPERRSLASRRPRLAYIGSPHALLRHQDGVRSLLAQHDRSRFDVQVWHWSAPQDDGRVSTPAGLDAEDLGAGSDAELARQVLSLEPDALVDLDGDGCHARPGLWPRLPASLRLAAFDRCQMPDDAPGAPTLSPWPVTLACAGPADALQAASPLRSRWRTRLGLPGKAPVLACLAPLESLSRPALDRLFALLQACPPAHLWLAPADPALRAAIVDLARAAGIAPERLHHTEAGPHALALRRGALSAVDLYLQLTPDWHDHALPDPLAQALAAAVPVLALAGTADPSGRVRALLKAADAVDACHDDIDAWQQAALAALRQPRALLAQRQQGISRHAGAPLFQPALLAGRLQDALLPPPPMARPAGAVREQTGTRASPRRQTLEAPA